MRTKRAADPLSSEDLDSVARTQQSYERIPYRTGPWPSARPSHLETTANLWGLEAAAADRCSMLELGCGDGGNLLPLALCHPESTFVGIDLAKAHISAGRGLQSRLALDNVRLEVGSFVDLDSDFGSFDYIVVHGLMSWVTPGLQEHLFAACKRLLSPIGVAFISYNTYPGWYMQHSIRELLRQHNRGVNDIQQRIERSRELLDILLQTVPARESAYRDYLESVGAVARDPSREYYFSHEYLEDQNHPFYVLDFIERAGAHGLQYLADADLIDMELDNMPHEPSELLEKLVESRAQRLQILDFAVNRKFRQSLLCHADVVLHEMPDLHRTCEMYIASNLEPTSADPPINGPAVVEFRDRHGRTIEVDQPLVKASLLRFCEESRQPIAFEELVDWACRRLGVAMGARDAQDRKEREILALLLGRIHLADMVDLQSSPPCWSFEPSTYPVASPLVRLELAENERTTTLRLRALAVDNAIAREVLCLLDGSRDRDALLQHFEGRLPADELEKILQLAADNAMLMK